MNEPTAENQFISSESEREGCVNDDARPSVQWQGYDVEILNAVLEGGGTGLRGDA